MNLINCFQIFLVPSIESVITYVLHSLPYFIKECAHKLYFESYDTIVISCPMKLQEINSGEDPVYKADICFNATNLRIFVSSL